MCLTLSDGVKIWDLLKGCVPLLEVGWHYGENELNIFSMALNSVYPEHSWCFLSGVSLEPYAIDAKGLLYTYIVEFPLVSFTWLLPQSQSLIFNNHLTLPSRCLMVSNLTFNWPPTLCLPTPSKYVPSAAFVISTLQFLFSWVKTLEYACLFYLLIHQ
jgi:hypothetical protein